MYIYAYVRDLGLDGYRAGDDSIIDTVYADFHIINRGEISRAMRNRCVEIYMPGEDPSTALDLHDIFMENLNSIEKLNPARLGVIYSRVWKRMCNIHRQVCTKHRWFFLFFFGSTVILDSDIGDSFYSIG